MQIDFPKILVQSLESFKLKLHHLTHHNVVTFNASHDPLKSFVFLSCRQMRIHAANKIIHKRNLRDREMRSEIIIRIEVL